MYNILFTLLCGLTWAWRGWTYPKMGGYIRALITSIIMVGGFCLLKSIPLISASSGLAILALTVAESLLGYGFSCGRIDEEHQVTGSLEFVKEEFIYLGCISMLYCILPFILLMGSLNALTYFVVMAIGFITYPPC